MTVQAVDVFFHHLKAVCNGFVDYETREKSALFCEGLAWKDDRGAAVTVGWGYTPSLYNCSGPAFEGQMVGTGAPLRRGFS